MKKEAFLKNGLIKNVCLPFWVCLCTVKPSSVKVQISAGEGCNYCQGETASGPWPWLTLSSTSAICLSFCKFQFPTLVVIYLHF